MGRGRMELRIANWRFNPKFEISDYLGVAATFTFAGRSNLSPIL